MRAASLCLTLLLVAPPVVLHAQVGATLGPGTRIRVTARADNEPEVGELVSRDGSYAALWESWHGDGSG